MFTSQIQNSIFLLILFHKLATIESIHLYDSILLAYLYCVSRVLECMYIIGMHSRYLPSTKTLTTLFGSYAVKCVISQDSIQYLITDLQVIN